MKAHTKNGNEWEGKKKIWKSLQNSSLHQQFSMHWFAYEATVMLIQLPVLLLFFYSADVYRMNIILANWYVRLDPWNQEKKRNKTHTHIKKGVFHFNGKSDLIYFNIHTHKKKTDENSTVNNDLLYS